MADEKRREIDEWMSRVAHDLRAAEAVLVLSPPLTDVAVFHCQQAAEKALKAFLVAHDVLFDKVHDLRVLVRTCRAIEPSFADLDEASRILTPYAVRFRYPAEPIDPSLDEANEALGLARSFVQKVEEFLPD